MVKRRTSTSVSSAGTPGPSASSVPPTTTTSPLRPGEGDDEADRAGGPSSRANASASATPAPNQTVKESLISADYRTAARPGVVAPGTGDGGAAGDECFMWNDLPMNKNGEGWLVTCSADTQDTGTTPVLRGRSVRRTRSSRSTGSSLARCQRRRSPSRRWTARPSSASRRTALQ